MIRKIVLGIAGAGKTHMLVNDFLKVKHDNAVILTFTRASYNRISEILRDKLAEEYEEEINYFDLSNKIESYLYTFHKFTNYSHEYVSRTIELNKYLASELQQILKQNNIKFSTNITLEEVNEELDGNMYFATVSFLENYYAKRINELSEKELNEGIKRFKFIHSISEFNKSKFLKFVNIFNKFKEEYNAVTFNDWLFDFINKETASVKHVFIDEFNEMTTLHFKFLEKIKIENLYFYGDVCQMIYSGLGTNIEYVYDLLEKNKDKIVVLKETHRIPKNLFERVKKVIVNKFKKNKKLSFLASEFLKSKTTNEETAKIKIIGVVRTNDVVYYTLLLEEVKNFLKRKEKVYVLFRNYKTLKKFAKLLISKKIFFRVLSQYRYLDYWANALKKLISISHEADANMLLEYTKNPLIEHLKNCNITNIEELDKNTFIYLTTIHAYKGHEADNIIAIFPHRLKTPLTDWFLEIDYDALYVALTRAKKSFTLIGPQTLRIYLE